MRARDVRSRWWIVVGCALVGVGCSSNPNIGDAKRQYLVPAVCEKQQACIDKASFDAAYPGGIEDCKTKAASSVPASQNDQESACSDEDWRTCTNDLKAATCPADPATSGGLPPMPASCDKC